MIPQKHPKREELKHFRNQQQLLSYFQGEGMELWKVNKIEQDGYDLINVTCQHCNAYFSWLHFSKKKNHPLKLFHYQPKNDQQVHKQKPETKSIGFPKNKNPLLSKTQNIDQKTSKMVCSKRFKQISKDLNQFVWRSKKLKRVALKIFHDHKSEMNKMKKIILIRQNEIPLQIETQKVHEYIETELKGGCDLKSEEMIRKLTAEFNLPFGRSLDFLEEHIKNRESMEIEEGGSIDHKGDELQKNKRIEKKRRVYNRASKSKKESSGPANDGEQSEKSEQNIQQQINENDSEGQKMIGRMKMKKEQEQEQVNYDKSIVDIGKEDVMNMKKFMFSQQDNLQQNFDFQKYFNIEQ